MISAASTFSCMKTGAAATPVQSDERRGIALPATGSPAAPAAAGPGKRACIGATVAAPCGGICWRVSPLPPWHCRPALAYAEIAGLSPVIWLVRTAVASSLPTPSSVPRVKLIVGPDGINRCSRRGSSDSIGRRSGAIAHPLAALLAILVGAVFLGSLAGPVGLDRGLLLPTGTHRLPPRGGGCT